MLHRRVGVSARSARRGRLAALGLGGQAQGHDRPLVPSGGWRHDARGLEGLGPGSGSVAGCGGRGDVPGVDLHVQDVGRHIELDRWVGWGVVE